jgi:hypothetical protein
MLPLVRRKHTIQRWGTVHGWRDGRPDCSSGSRFFPCSAAVAFGLPPFTTAPKSSPPGSAGQTELFGIAAACHSTFDRFVIRARFATPGYSVRYVQQVVSPPSGMPVSLPGAGRLHVVVRQARGHTTGGTSLLPSTLTPACRNLLKIKGAGDSEGIVSFGLGLRRKTGFRVFRLTGPTRIVVDVAH